MDFGKRLKQLRTTSEAPAANSASWSSCARPRAMTSSRGWSRLAWLRISWADAGSGTVTASMRANLRRWWGKIRSV